MPAEEAVRVVSLLPSATEIVFALGHGEDLVGRSAECDFPAAARDRPVVMRPRTLDATAPSGAIDSRVSEARARGESLYALDETLLARLRPDLLLTQDLCGVCSVTGDEVETACRHAGVRPSVVSLTPRHLEDVWRSVEVVGEALRAPAQGHALAERLRRRSEGRSGPPGPRVAVVEWTDPPILAGLWTPEMVGAAGGVPVGPAGGSPGRRTSWDELGNERPDLIVIAPCSFSVERTLAELREPGTLTALAGLPPPPLGIYVADEAYFSRPGPRLADGVDLLRHLLEGAAWAAPMPYRALPIPEAPA